MADRFEKLDRSLRDLKEAVETHNRLPDDFPGATIVGICDTLFLHSAGTRSCRLHELVYARNKLSNIHDDHFGDEEDAAPDVSSALGGAVSEG